MKRTICLLLTVLLLFGGCAQKKPSAQIAATTLPVYEFASYLCSGTDIQVTRLITQDVSCLHNFSLQVDQTRAIEAAQVLIASGAGLDDFITDLAGGHHTVIDASAGIELHCNEDAHDHHDGHHHEEDPHIWLSIENARAMAENICTQLAACYPQYAEQFQTNMDGLDRRFDELRSYGESQLSTLSGKEIITFHDGFSYLAEDWGITILAAIEEESGSEASAAQLIEMIRLVEEHNVAALFTEKAGSTSAAEIVSRETGTPVYELDMAMSGDSWFDAMTQNFDTLKEALE